MQKIESWRLFFPAAAALMVGGLGAWAAQLSGIPLGLSASQHAAFMLWGVLGTGVQGFLLTAYAKQNDAPLPSLRHLQAQLGLQVLAALAELTGHLGWFPLLSWISLLFWVLPVAWRSLSRRWEPTTASVPVALLLGIGGLFLHLSSNPTGIQVGLQGFLVPLALAVLDRVLPFFSTRALPSYTGTRRPYFLGPLLLLTLIKLIFPESAPWSSLALMALLLRQWWGWRFDQVRAVPMLAILHVGVGWLGLGWALEAAGMPVSVVSHAIGAGGLGSLLLGISMRVVRGHGGMPMVLGRMGAGLWGLAQLGVLLRVGAGLWGGGGGLLVGSASILGLAFALWLVRFVPTCLRVPA